MAWARSWRTHIVSKGDVVSIVLGSAPSGSDATRTSRFAAAGVALVGAGLITVNPAAPVPPDIQHRYVHLTAGADDFMGWSSVFERAGDNLDALLSNSNIPTLLEQIGGNLKDYGQLIIGMENVPLDARIVDGEPMTRFVTSGFAGIGDALQKMIFGVESDPFKYPGLETLFERMADYAADGNAFGVFNDLNLWTLYGLEDIGKAMAPVLSIPARMLENLSSAVSEFVGPLDAWSFIKEFSGTQMEPLIGVFYQLANTITQAVGGDLNALLSAPADLMNALINGWEVPDTPNVFVGLLNDGSLLDALLVDWPARLAEALTVGTADLPTNAASAAADAVDPGAFLDLFGSGDVLSGLF